MILIGLLFEALLAVWIFGCHGGSRWGDPVDIWQTVDGGRFVAEGAFPYVYQGTNSYSLPLGFIAMAPAAALIDILHLGEGAPFPIPKATGLLVVVPYCFVFAAALLHAVRRLAWTMGVRRRLWATQLAALVVVLVPSFYWGHPEDVLALTFVLHALRRAHLRSCVAGGLLLSFAISSKQWAVMLIPLLLAVSPRPDRRRVLLAAVALPAAFVAVTLGFDWKDAFPALFEPVTPMHHTQGQTAFFSAWFGDRTSLVTRTAGAFACIPVAWYLRRWREGAGLLASAALILAIRPLSEPVSFAYYWCPAALVGLCSLVASRRAFGPSDWVMAVLVALWGFPGYALCPRLLWWTVQYGLVGLLGLQVLLAGRHWKSRHVLKEGEWHPILTT